MRGDRGGNQALDVGAHADVADDSHAVAPGRTHVCEGLVERLGPPTRDHQSSALAREGHCRAAPESAPSAGDQCHLAVETSCHVCVPAASDPTAGPVVVVRYARGGRHANARRRIVPNRGRRRRAVARAHPKAAERRRDTGRRPGLRYSAPCAARRPHGAPPQACAGPRSRHPQAAPASRTDHMPPEIPVSTLSALRRELPPMLRLAVPVVLAELGWMSMGLVDTIMVGRLGPAAIGATGIGSSLHIAFAIFGMGLLLGLDTLVSQAYGAKDLRECHRWLFRASRWRRWSASRCCCCAWCC